MEAVAAFRAPFLRKDVARLAAYENRMKKIELGYVGQRYGGQDNEEGEAKSKNNMRPWNPLVCACIASDNNKNLCNMIRVAVREQIGS